MGKGNFRYALACGVSAFISIGLLAWASGEAGVCFARDRHPFWDYRSVELGVLAAALLAALAGGALGFWRQYHLGARRLGRRRPSEARDFPVPPPA